MLFFSFVVGVTFRALSDDGLLLYATDNDTHPTQFFQLSLSKGEYCSSSIQVEAWCLLVPSKSILGMATGTRYVLRDIWKRYLPEDHNPTSISTNFGDEAEV